MLMTLISLLGGGALRLLPEVISVINKFMDNGHELEMMKLQLQLQQGKAQDDRAMAELKFDSDSVLASLDAQKSALIGQMQKVGIKWVDALNFLVRPLATYYFLAMYGLAKVAVYVVATQNGVPPWDAATHIWAPEDTDILAGILSFWFVGRVFDKQRHK